VVQIYAATNGYLDRINVDKVERFLGDLSDHVRGSEPELLKKIAEGDWEEGTVKAVDEAVKQFAEDFGYDLDEEGHPLEEDEDRDRERSREEEGSEDSGDDEDQGEEEKAA
jgi:F-type H+-transporting ATPase subunit alpha